MIINKITTGFVIQQFDTDTGKFVGQSFTACSEVAYENVAGETIEDDVMAPLGFGPDAEDEPYMPFDMKQPEETVDKSLKTI
jgi:hypothetical protein